MTKDQFIETMVLLGKRGTLDIKTHRMKMEKIDLFVIEGVDGFWKAEELAGMGSYFNMRFHVQGVSIKI